MYVSVRFRVLYTLFHSKFSYEAKVITGLTDEESEAFATSEVLNGSARNSAEHV